LQWEEALMVASLRIRRIICYDAIAFWACEDDFVRVKFAGGEDRAGLELLSVRQGEGLAGWVAEVGQPILNGNPTVEPGYQKHDAAPGAKPDETPGLSSALALPLVSAGNVVGVVALYRRGKDAFGSNELAALLDLCPDLASLMLDNDRPDADSPNRLLEMANAVQHDGERLVRA
jgi:GAF domain-containing protein